MGLLSPFSVYPVQAQALNSGKKKKENKDRCNYQFESLDCPVPVRFHADTKPKRNTKRFADGA